MKKKRKLLASVISGIMALSLMIYPVNALETTETNNESTISGTQKAYIVGDDWGAGIYQTVITFDETIEASSVDVDDFSVVQNVNGTESPRTVLDAYTSDATGTKTSRDSQYVTITMYISPTEGNPIVWSSQTWRNTWPESCELSIALNEGENIKGTDGTIYTTLNVLSTLDVNNDLIIPQLDNVDLYTGDDAFTDTNGLTYSYAMYSPEEDSQKHALVIWLHGVGEGGNDPRVTVLANKVTALWDDEFQDIFDGAYILAIQSASAWNQNQVEGVYELIQKIISENPSIDADRVIIGGCSAGGGMTMRMITSYPEVFAAAYPICPVVSTDWTEKLDQIIDMPIWFTHAKNDTTVNYESSTETYAQKLIEMGNTQVHTTVWDDVHDTTGRFTDEYGNPYQYDGHWSWIYFDNNMNYDDNDPSLNEWEWLAQQTRAIESEESVTPDDSVISTESENPNNPTVSTELENPIDFTTTDETPSTDNLTNTPVNTGDQAPIALLLIILLVSAVGMIKLLRKKTDS